MAMINPSGLLTQAYRGTGLFPQPLPVRILAVYPSLDHFVYVIHPRTGLKSLAEIKEKKYPLRFRFAKTRPIRRACWSIKR